MTVSNYIRKLRVLELQVLKSIFPRIRLVRSRRHELKLKK